MFYYPGLFILYALFALDFILPVVFLGFYTLIISYGQMASEDGVLCRGSVEVYVRAVGKREAVEKCSHVSTESSFLNVFHLRTFSFVSLNKTSIKHN